MLFVDCRSPNLHFGRPRRELVQQHQEYDSDEVVDELFAAEADRMSLPGEPGAVGCVATADIVVLGAGF